MRQVLSWIVLKTPLWISALLGAYTLWYTHVALEPFTHEKRITDLDRLVMLGLLKAESGQRGYLLTGDRAFLEQYHEGLKGLNNYEPLYGEVLVDERSKRLFMKLEEVLRRKLDEMALTIKLREKESREAAITMFRNKCGYSCTKQVHDLRRQIRNLEKNHSSALEFLHLPPASSTLSWGS